MHITRYNVITVITPQDHWNSLLKECSAYEQIDQWGGGEGGDPHLCAGARWLQIVRTTATTRNYVVQMRSMVCLWWHSMFYKIPQALMLTIKLSVHLSSTIEPCMLNLLFSCTHSYFTCHWYFLIIQPRVLYEQILSACVIPLVSSVLSLPDWCSSEYFYGTDTALELALVGQYSEAQPESGKDSTELTNGITQADNICS